MACALAAAAVPSLPAEARPDDVVVKSVSPEFSIAHNAAGDTAITGGIDLNVSEAKHVDGDNQSVLEGDAVLGFSLGKSTFGSGPQLAGNPAGSLTLGAKLRLAGFQDLKMSEPIIRDLPGVPGGPIAIGFSYGVQGAGESVMPIQGANESAIFEQSPLITVQGGPSLVGIGPSGMSLVTLTGGLGYDGVLKQDVYVYGLRAKVLQDGQFAFLLNALRAVGMSDGSQSTMSADAEVQLTLASAVRLGFDTKVSDIQGDPKQVAAEGVRNGVVGVEQSASATLLF